MVIGRICEELWMHFTMMDEVVSTWNAPSGGRWKHVFLCWNIASGTSGMSAGPRKLMLCSPYVTHFVKWYQGPERWCHLKSHIYVYVHTQCNTLQSQTIRKPFPFASFKIFEKAWIKFLRWWRHLWDYVFLHVFVPVVKGRNSLPSLPLSVFWKEILVGLSAFSPCLLFSNSQVF
jgi:hypothetical protein